MINLSNDEMLALKEELRNCRITNEKYEYISDKDAFNEYVEAYKECKSINIKDKDNFKKYIGDFLRFQFDNQVLEYYDDFTLYVDEDANFTLDYGYNKNKNVFEVIFKQPNGWSLILTRSLSDVDEWVKEMIEETQIDENEDIDLDKWIENNKEQRIKMYEYEYICDLIDEFTKEYILNHN